MTKRHYIAMADLLRKELELCENREQVGVVESIRDRMAAMFAEENPRFDEARFKEACEL